MNIEIMGEVYVFSNITSQRSKYESKPTYTRESNPRHNENETDTDIIKLAASLSYKFNKDVGI